MEIPAKLFARTAQQGANATGITQAQCLVRQVFAFLGVQLSYLRF